MPEVTPYHTPPSYYSQTVRLVLAEKGAAWRSKFAVPGPPILETYQPWYMRINPMGTGPILVHDGKTITETIEIARHLDANFEGPPLIPGDESERAAMERRLTKIYEISGRELSYSSEKQARFGAFVHRWRAPNPETLGTQKPGHGGNLTEQNNGLRRFRRERRRLRACRANAGTNREHPRQD